MPIRVVGGSSWQVFFFLISFSFFFFETEGNKPTPMGKEKRGKSCTVLQKKGY
jgi:hypothetical protein